MSKNLKAILALLIAFSLFTTAAKAQEEDFDGFAPIEESKPDVPVADMVAPVAVDQTRLQRYTELQMSEVSGYQTSKDKYNTATAVQKSITDGGQTDSAAVNYKLKAIIISARYHKTLGLYLAYLQKIDQLFSDYSTTTGFEVEGAEASLNKVENEITNISSLVNQYDTAIDSFTSTSDTDVEAFSQELMVVSNQIKASLKKTQSSLSTLVSMAE